MGKKKAKQGIIKAFNAAIAGILYTFKHERNMKIHYFVAALVLTASLFCEFNRFEMMILLFNKKIAYTCHAYMYSLSFNSSSCS